MVTADKPPVKFPTRSCLLFIVAAVVVVALDFFKGPTIAALVTVLLLAIYSITSIVSIRRTSPPQEVTQATLSQVIWFVVAAVLLSWTLGARIGPDRGFGALIMGAYGLLFLYMNVRQQGKAYSLSTILWCFVLSTLLILPQSSTSRTMLIVGGLVFALLFIIDMVRQAKMRGQPQNGWRWW